MSDENNGGVGDDNANSQGDEGAGNSDQNNSEKNSQHNDADAGDGEGDNSQDDKDSRRNNPDGDDEEGEDDDENAEPPTRKSKLQYIKERQEKARLKKEQQFNSQKKQDNSQDDDDDSEKDDESFSDSEKKLLSKMERVFLKKHGDKFEKVDKVIEATEHSEVNEQITEFLKNDEYGDLVKEHEKTLRKYALHPSRREVPIEELMYGIAGRKLIAFGAEQARKAMKEAQQSKNARASSNRKVEGNQSKPVSEQTDAEFLEEQQRVLRNRK